MSTTWIIIISIIAFAVLLCFLLAVANYSYDKFLQNFQSLNKRPIRAGLSTLDFISGLNDKYFNGALQIVQISALAGDAYLKGKIYLSTSSLYQNSLASFTIIAHEMGHARQDKEGKKLKHLLLMRRIGRLLGVLFAPSIIAGLIFLIFEGALQTAGIVLLASGAGIFLLALLVKILTISIEKDASKKAIVFLSEILNSEELQLAKSLLRDAKLTYWADFLRILLGWTALSKKSKLFN